MKAEATLGSNIKWNRFESHLTAKWMNWYKRRVGRAMGKGVSLLVIVAGLLLSQQPLASHEFSVVGRDIYQSFLRTVHSRLERFAALLTPSKIPFLADGGGGDGGGDGGGGSGDGGGGSGDGGGSGTGGGTGAGAAGGAGDGAGAAGGAGTGGACDGKRGGGG